MQKGAHLHSHILDIEFGKNDYHPAIELQSRYKILASNIDSHDNLAAEVTNIHSKVEKIKGKQQESKKVLDSLFNSLIQKAFSGA